MLETVVLLQAVQLFALVYLIRALKGQIADERERNDRYVAALLTVGSEKTAANTITRPERADPEHPLQRPRQIGLSPR